MFGLCGSLVGRVNKLPYCVGVFVSVAGKYLRKKKLRLVDFLTHTVCIL